MHYGQRLIASARDVLQNCSGSDFYAAAGTSIMIAEYFLADGAFRLLKTIKNKWNIQKIVFSLQRA